MILFRFLFTLLLFLNGCSEQKASKETDGATLHLNFASEPATFDPRRASYTNNANMFPLLFDGLYRITPDGKATPSLAETVQISPDGLKYTFILKKTVWSNGDPVTAYDFEQAWKWMLTPTNPAWLADFLYPLKNASLIHQGGGNIECLGVYAKDSDTLVVELEEPCPYFLQLLTQLSFYPTHRNDPTLTNGPFMVEENRQGKHLTLQKNPLYWDQEQVKIDRIEISFISDPNTELYLFEKGELDFAGPPLSVGMPLDAISNLPNLQIVPINAIYFYSLNVHHPLLQNKKIRQALSLSIDRQELVTHLTKGEERPTTTLNLQEREQPLPEEAELIALFRAGYLEAKSPPLTLTLSFNKNELHSNIAQFIHHRWTTLFGLEVIIAGKEWKGYVHDLKNGLFDCIRGGWRPLVNDLSALLEIFEDPEHPLQHSYWDNAEFSELLRSGRKMVDPKKRRETLQRALALLNEETPIIPLYYSTLCFLKNPKLKGELFSPSGMIDFKWSYFEPQ